MNSQPQHFMKNISCFMMTMAVFLIVCQSKPHNSFPTSLKSLCEMTLYPVTCCNTLIGPIINSKIMYTSQLIYQISVQVSIDEVSRVSKNFTKNQKLQYTNKLELQSAFESCDKLFLLALYRLNFSSYTSAEKTRDDYRTWLSSASSDLQTCIDGFENAPNGVRASISKILNKSTRLISNSLAIISKVDDDWIRSSPDNHSTLDVKCSKRPSWLPYDNWNILESPEHGIKADIVVASDGSGEYKTISEALEVAPRNSEKRFVIYVKKGLYREIVRVEISHWNILMYGDGMDLTVVSGNLNARQGMSILINPTFAVFGKGFIAQDMGFENTAGPENHQAVALLSDSDESVFYRCRIDGYQDTLFTKSNRQFYRDCKIYGTQDFIFGDSSVVLQNCTILVKRPLPKQKNYITAQGKYDPNSNTGISIQNCSIIAAENLDGVRTYLGRPWKAYSTTVYMESDLGSLIDPQGWAPWKKNVTPPDTIFFAEYNNKGPGAPTTKRIRLNGVHWNIHWREASKFTVRSLIGGDEWLPTSDVPFHSDL